MVLENVKTVLEKYGMVLEKHGMVLENEKTVLEKCEMVLETFLKYHPKYHDDTLDEKRWYFRGVR
jgi:hypothetical protein